MEISEMIKKSRKEAGLTQGELAERLNVTSQMISQYETGKRTPKYETLKKIAAALDVNVMDLVNPAFGNILSEAVNNAAGQSMQDITRDYGISVAKVLEHLESQGIKPKAKISLQLFAEGEEILTQFDIIKQNYYKLNEIGKEEAAKRIEELTYIEKYTKED